MALDQCVKEIICTLSSAALSSLNVLIDGQKSLLQAQITQYQTQLLQYDLIAPAIQASRDAAQLIVDEARSITNFIPLNIIADCVDLGDFYVNISGGIDLAIAYADDLTFEATRLLSYRDELNAIISEFNETIDQLTDIQRIISECLAGS
jgi:hypothetical protein